MLVEGWTGLYFPNLSSKEKRKKIMLYCSSLLPSTSQM